MSTRFPFRYGIASLSRLPHLIVRAEVEVDHQRCIGMAADGLAPKWFTKNPDTDFEQQDLPQMLRVIQHAANLSRDLGAQANFFSWWHELYASQHAWAADHNLPPLLANFGCSLIERAVLEACCRRHEISLSSALRSNVLALDLGVIRSELSNLQPVDVLPKQPLPSVVLRHTVGISDPFTDGELDPSDQVKDGLPHSLVSAIRTYGLTHFKIKLSGNHRQDRERLQELAGLLRSQVGKEMRFTLDANEQYESMESFRDQWRALCLDPPVRRMIDESLLFVEQPVHRDFALHDETYEAFNGWPDAPPIIIDESDADLGTLPRALKIGYAGTSHKNCKGVVKSLAAAATIRNTDDLRNTNNLGQSRILSGEDLANVGPIALNQDLAVVAALGIPHVERNGHHYFAGLQMYSRAIQEQVVSDHPDLYAWHDEGFAHVMPQGGRLHLESLNLAPLGVARLIDLRSIDRWDLSGYS
ncbi:MAG: hypothetical protein ACR2NZ_02305 [Rubripirellula sp.]